jgi:hypothetical protein
MAGVENLPVTRQNAVGLGQESKPAHNEAEHRYPSRYSRVC